MRRYLAVFVLLSIRAFAQLPGDGITTSASKTVTLSPDSAIFIVDVSSAAGTTVDQAAAWLRDTGITATNLVGAASTQEFQFSPPGAAPAMRMVHEFQITVPYAKIKDMTDKLRAATRVIAAAEGSLAYGLALTASDEAVQLARQRVLPDLIAELKRRADTLAGASGLLVGTIQSISETSYLSGAIVPRVYSSPGLIGSSSSFVSGGLQANFSASAKFSVLRSGL